MCFSPVAQQRYLHVLVPLHLAVGLSVSPQLLMQTLFCSRLLVFQLLLELMDPEVEEHEENTFKTESQLQLRVTLL